MPYKSGKLKDELTTAEIRKLVRAHNAVIKKNLIIKIPAGSTRDKIIKIINDKGFDIRHAQKRIEPLDNVSAYDYISLDMVEKILKKPEKTELQKQKTAEAKQAREQKKKKEEREIRKKAVQEEKARAKPKAKPKAKTATIETQTEKPKPKKEPKKEEPKTKQLRQKKKIKEMQELEEEVNESIPPPKKTVVNQPVSNLTKKDLEDAQFEAINKYETLRKARKEEKRKKQAIEKSKQDLVDKLKPTGYRYRDGSNRWDACY
jgi:chemotaxis protein histidine kinase CheA